MILLRVSWWITHIVTSNHCRDPRRVDTTWYPCRESVWGPSHSYTVLHTDTSSCTDITSLRLKPVEHSSEELTIIATGAFTTRVKSPFPKRTHPEVSRPHLPLLLRWPKIVILHASPLVRFGLFYLSLHNLANPHVTNHDSCSWDQREHTLMMMM